MKINFNKNIILGLALFLAVGTFNSCLEDDVSITEPTRYTENDVQSYADLFKVFWNVMDQRYNYFYEQKRNDGMDWDAVYKEYYPKFAALKTFGRTTDNDKDINDDRLIAVQYFTDIIDPIMDRHFQLRAALPASSVNGVRYNVTFSGGMKTKASNIYAFSSKYEYMKDRLVNGSIVKSDSLLAGNLKSNPDIYYFSFPRFSLTWYFKIDLLDKYLSPDPGNGILLTTADIDASQELAAIKDPAFRNKVRDFTVNVLNQWNAFPVSAEVRAFNDQIATFKSTEVVSDTFLEAAQKALTKYKNVVDYSSDATYASITTPESSAYIQWFKRKIYDHAWWGYGINMFLYDAKKVVIHRAPFYKQFLNPLHQGGIKKLIIDLRGNGGGDVIDGRFFIDRFITKNAVWGYQRTKEGNGRFNYTPWVPMRANPHQFGLPSNIPITILTDKGSASMSEMTTMMLKTQGSQVVSVGDYSAGATAGLAGSDDFNGGIAGQVTSYLSFYMPVMATKDASGEVIEGVGVKPDLYVTPPTDAEVAAMESSPSTFTDRVMNKAIEFLSSK